MRTFMVMSAMIVAYAIRPAMFDHPAVFAILLLPLVVDLFAWRLDDLD